MSLTATPAMSLTSLECVLAAAASSPRDSMLHSASEVVPLLDSLRYQLGVFVVSGRLPATTVDAHTLREFFFSFLFFFACSRTDISR